jgi:hypothetical protein
VAGQIEIDKFEKHRFILRENNIEKRKIITITRWLIGVVAIAKTVPTEWHSLGPILVIKGYKAILALAYYNKLIVLSLIGYEPRRFDRKPKFEDSYQTKREQLCYMVKNDTTKVKIDETVE